MGPVGVQVNALLPKTNIMHFNCLNSFNCCSYFYYSATELPLRCLCITLPLFRRKPDLIREVQHRMCGWTDQLPKANLIRRPRNWKWTQSQGVIMLLKLSMVITGNTWIAWHLDLIFKSHLGFACLFQTAMHICTVKYQVDDCVIMINSNGL